MPSGVEKRVLDRGRTLVVAVVAMAALAALAVVIFLLPSSSPPASGSLAFIDSRYPNVDVSNSRHARGSIQGSTVSDLEVAWTVPITATGDYGGNSSSPVVAGGVVYSQDLESKVQAIELESGEILWEKTYKSATVGPNGVVVANDLVYGATTTDVFALDRKTGQEVWSTPLARNESEEIHMAPGYHEGLVYASTVPVATEGGEVGVLWALDGETGEKVWSFDTVPKDLWGNRKLNFGGGLSYTPAFDASGSMYFGVGNPGPAPGTKRYPWGTSRPGPNLYTQSVVKLDAETGKLQWYYQVTPHGLCNWDIGPPVLVKAGGRDLVIAGGRSGIVVALDRQTGKLVWRRAVGVHNGHDNDGLYAMRGEYSKLKLPMKVYPGALGGVLAPLSVSSSTVFVPVVNAASLLASQGKAKPVGSTTGELVALDAATGAVEWKHNFPSAPFGAPTAVNDLVFATTADGTLYGFDDDSGEEMWKTSLPAGFNAGLTISGSTLLAPAGLLLERGLKPKILAYRLPS